MACGPHPRTTAHRHGAAATSPLRPGAPARREQHTTTRTCALRPLAATTWRTVRSPFTPEGAEA